MIHLVVGSGNGGLALAADLALRGERVRLLEHPSFADSFARLAATRELLVDGLAAEPARVKLDQAGLDPDTALDGAGLVHVAVPVYAQDAWWAQLVPRLGASQPLMIWAGRFGGTRLAALCATEYPGAVAFPIVEANTLPYGSRRTGEDSVRIVFRATRLYAGPAAGDARPALRALQRLFPVLTPVASALEAALRNSALPVLSVGTVLNAGAVESRGGEFALFRDGMTPAVRAVVRAVHGEIVAVAEALGTPVEPYPDEVYDNLASIESANFRDEHGGVDGFLRLTGPDRVCHRYTLENVRYGLEPIARAGHARGVATPRIDAICALTNAMCGDAFAGHEWSPFDEPSTTAAAPREM